MQPRLATSFVTLSVYRIRASEDLAFLTLEVHYEPRRQTDN